MIAADVRRARRFPLSAYYVPSTTRISGLAVLHARRSRL